MSDSIGRGQGSGATPTGFTAGEGVKQRDIRPCAACGKGLMHDNQSLCTRVTVTRLGPNIGAIRRQSGLELMLGGHAGLAHAMGTQEDMLVPLGESATLFLCDSCSMERRVCELHEMEAASPSRGEGGQGQ